MKFSFVIFCLFCLTFCIQIAGIILATIFLLHGLLAVGFKVSTTCLVLKTRFCFKLI